MGNGLRRGIAAGNYRRFFFRLRHRSLYIFFLTGLTGICIIPVLPDLYLCWDHYKRAPDFLANLNHLAPTGGAFQILSVYPVLHNFNGNIFRQNFFQFGGAFLSGMSGYAGSFILLRYRQVCLRFVEQQTHLFIAVPAHLLRGRTEQLLSGKSNRLHELFNLLFKRRDPFTLRLKSFVFCTRNAYHFRVACLHICCVFHE